MVDRAGLVDRAVHVDPLASAAGRGCGTGLPGSRGTRGCPVRGRVHGVRERRARAARDRLHRARPASGRAGRAGHALRVGVLGAVADAPGIRLHGRRVLGAGARHPRRRLRPVRAHPARDARARPGPRGDQGRRAAARRARRRRRARHPSRAAHRRDVGREPVSGRGALRCPGGGRRRLAGTRVGVRRAPRRRPGGAGRHPRVVLRPSWCGRRCWGRERLCGRAGRTGRAGG